MFGRHVGEFAFELSFLRRTKPDRRLRDSKVGNAGDPVCAHHDVVWRYITVNQVEWLAVLVRQLVRSAQTFQCIGHDSEGCGRGNACAALEGVLQ